MNEFDLRSYLYNNPLLESEAKLKAAKKKLEKQEAKLDKVDMKDEDAKEKAKHHKDAIKNVKKEIKDLEKDLKFDEKAEKKEEKEAKKKKAMKEGMSYYEDDEGKGKKGMTKEGLKSMIREKITSILNEEEELMEQGNIDPGVEPKSFLKKKPDYQVYEQEDDEVDVDVEKDVDVKDKEEVDVDVEKEKEVDDVSKETDIDVKTSLPGESEDVDAILGLLTKASEEADRFSDDPELKTQIGNTITYFTRKHIAKPTNEGEEVNEKFLGFGSDVKTGSTLGIGTDKGGLIFSKLGKGRYKLIHPTSHPSFREGQIWKPRQDEKNLRVGQSFPGLGEIEGLRVDGESKKKVKT